MTTLETYDWESAFEYAAPDAIITERLTCKVDRFAPTDVAEIFNMREGTNDEESWLIWGRLKDDRYFYLKAWCAFTGWGCQAGGQAYVGMDLENFKRFGLDDEARKEWYITVEQPAVGGA